MRTLIREIKTWCPIRVMGINTKSRKSILFIVICTAIVYVNSLGNGFVWDDNVLLVPNEAYKKLDFGRIFFTKVNSLEYLPFRDLS